LLRYDDGNSYVTKFRGNPQGDKILVSELVASGLLKDLDFARVTSRIVTVDAYLMSMQPELAGFTAGPQFGSLHERDNAPFSEDAITRLTNRNDLPQVILFDALVCNGDRNSGNILLIKDTSRTAVAYRFAMIDHSHIFGGPQWNSHTLATLKSSQNLYLSTLNLNHVPAKLDVFEPFLLRLEALTPDTIKSILDEVPVEWALTSSDKDALQDFLVIRKGLVRSVISAAIGTP
jgi:hypothetical protein